MMNCVIIDDEPLAVDVIKSFVNRTPGLRFYKSFDTGSEALPHIKEDASLIFLDIQMPGLSGMDVIKEIDNSQSRVILTTAYSEFAIEAFEGGVLDYLVKPISYERFLQSIQKYYLLKESFRESKITAQHDTAPSFFITDSNLNLKVEINSIQYIKGDGNYCHIYLAEKALTITGNIGSIELKLKKDNFIRIHKSYLVPLAKIRAYNKTSVYLDNVTLPVGKSFRKQVSDALSKMKL